MSLRPLDLNFSHSVKPVQLGKQMQESWLLEVHEDESHDSIGQSKSPCDHYLRSLENKIFLDLKTFLHMFG